MTLEQLRILKHIVEFGSLKEAALRLHKTQPALSIAIKKLETEFGFQILDRNQYRLALTPQGKVFYHEVEVLLAESDHLQSLGKQLAQGSEAVFKISIEQLFAYTQVIPVLKQAYQKFPATEFQLRSGSRFASLQDINDDRADLGIGPWFHLFNAQGEYDSFNIGTFDVILVASPELVDNQNTLTYEALCALPNIAILKSQFSFDSDKLSNYRGGRQFKVSDMQSLKALLMGGVGWAIIPRHIIAEELENGSLLQINCSNKESEFRGDMRVFRRSNKVPGPVAQFLWQELKALAAQNL